MPTATDRGGGNGKKDCAAGAALNHIAGIGKMVPVNSKSSLNKNIWKIDSETGTYQNCSCDHDPFKPVDISSYSC